MGAQQIPPRPRGAIGAAAASRQLGLSAKALRLYEQRGLLRPPRSAAGWRAYGPAELRRAAEIATLRRLGFSLAQVARLLRGDPAGLAPALEAHQAALEQQLQALLGTLAELRGRRAALAGGQLPSAAELARLLAPPVHPGVALDLPWPWGGERFALPALRPLTHITGPLGSGKTRLARALAAALPGARFLGPERAAAGQAGLRAALARDPALAARAEALLATLRADGATESAALLALLLALAEESQAPLVIDMLEQGLDRATQEALIALLRRRGPAARPLLFLTRSTAILDLDSVGEGESILFCPANHAPPFLVAPHPGAPGHEALCSCLAAPEVRARSEGMLAWRPAAGG